MIGVRSEEFASGDPLFVFDGELRVLAWNTAAERFTGLKASEAIGRYCWEVLSGHDDTDNLVCHPGCSFARLAREGWPVPCHALVLRAHEDNHRIVLSTVAVGCGDERVFLHLMVPPPMDASTERERAGLHLTARQRETLRLLGQGVPAKAIAAQLGLAEHTVRNHIRAVLLELGSHSQLEALAKARRLGLV